MEINKALFDNLQIFFGFDNFKGDQEAIITNILQKKNTQKDSVKRLAEKQIVIPHK